RSAPVMARATRSSQPGRRRRDNSPQTARRRSLPPRWPTTPACATAPPDEFCGPTKRRSPRRRRPARRRRRAVPSPAPWRWSSSSSLGPHTTPRTLSRRHLLLLGGASLVAIRRLALEARLQHLSVESLLEQMPHQHGDVAVRHPDALGPRRVDG